MVMDLRLSPPESYGFDWLRQNVCIGLSCRQDECSDIWTASLLSLLGKVTRHVPASLFTLPATEFHSPSGCCLQMLEALRDNPPPAIVALQSALAALYPEFNIRHMPAPVLSDAELPNEEEEGEEEGPEPLSSFVGEFGMCGLQE